MILAFLTVDALILKYQRSYYEKPQKRVLREHPSWRSDKLKIGPKGCQEILPDSDRLIARGPSSVLIWVELLGKKAHYYRKIPHQEE